jgi:hypothetical protein
MKFVLAFTVPNGGSAKDREHADKRAMQLLSKFVPSVDISVWVDRIDGRGGFAVFESDDPAAMTKDIAIWAPLLDFELHPVLDMTEATAAAQEAIDFRDSIS